MIGRVLGLAALGVAVVAVVLLLSSGGDTYEVTAEFENAGQLVKGNEVVIGGTAVGTVKTIELGSEGQAQVTFSVGDGLRAARPRHRRDRALALALADRGPPGPADDPARLGVELRPDPRRRHDGPVRDRLGRRPRSALQHPLAEDDQGLQARDRGLRGVLRRGLQAGQRGVQVRQPVPVDLAARLRRAELRSARLREPDRRHVAALRRARRAGAADHSARLEPRHDDERDRRPQGAARRRDLAAAGLPARSRTRPSSTSARRSTTSTRSSTPRSPWPRACSPSWRACARRRPTRCRRSATCRRSCAGPATPTT